MGHYYEQFEHQREPFSNELHYYIQNTVQPGYNAALGRRQLYQIYRIYKTTSAKLVGKLMGKLIGNFMRNNSMLMPEAAKQHGKARAKAHGNAHPETIPFGNEAN